MEKVMRDVRALDQRICENWDTLDAHDKEFFHALLIGAVETPSTWRERASVIAWSASTIYNMTFRREEAVRYLLAIQELLEKIKHRVSSEVWRETLVSSEHVEKATNGRRQINSGEFDVLFSPAQE